MVDERSIETQGAKRGLFIILNTILCYRSKKW